MFVVCLGLGASRLGCPGRLFIFQIKSRYETGQIVTVQNIKDDMGSNYSYQTVEKGHVTALMPFQKRRARFICSGET